jgi:hypothetical protein
MNIDQTAAKILDIALHYCRIILQQEAENYDFNSIENIRHRAERDIREVLQVQNT